MSLTALSVGSGTAAFNFTGGTLQAGGAATNVAMLLNGAAVIDASGHTMTIQGLVTTSGLTDLNFDVTSPGGVARVMIGSGGLIVNPNTAISFGVNPTIVGDYPLIGGEIGTPLLSDFVLPLAPVGESYSLAIIAGQIDLVVAAVPEPSTFALLGVGAVCLIGCGGLRRRWPRLLVPKGHWTTTPDQRDIRNIPR